MFHGPFFASVHSMVFNSKFKWIVYGIKPYQANWQQHTGFQFHAQWVNYSMNRSKSVIYLEWYSSFTTVFTLRFWLGKKPQLLYIVHRNQFKINVFKLRFIYLHGVDMSLVCTGTGIAWRPLWLYFCPDLWWIITHNWH